MLAGGAVAWRTMKQTLITTSTMQAEFIAVYEAVCEGLWIRNFLMQTKILSHIVTDALEVYCDNEAAVFFIKNSKRSNNSKNIDTNSQLADLFTKALSVAAFQKHTENIDVLPNLDV
jgi:hypothetical protein